MEPRIVSLPAFVVAGFLHHGNSDNGELPALWERVGPTLSALPSTEPDVYYGVIDHFDEATKTFDYVAGRPVAPDSLPQEGNVRWEIPAQTYAVFSCTLKTLMPTFGAAYQWVGASGRARAEGPEFERYGPDFDESPEQPLTLWIPIT
jgi:AraC family transcriptional regulator